MKTISCITVANPFSYLVCRGIKDVETKSSPTDYRGKLFIHSGGRTNFMGMPDLGDYPVPVIHEFNEVMGKIQQIEDESDFIGFKENGVAVILKDEGRRSEEEIRQYRLLSDAYRHYRDHPGKPFFLVDIIIGSVELVDVVRDHDSPWAGAGDYHYLLANPSLLAQPITSVRGGYGVWEYSIPDEG